MSFHVAPIWASSTLNIERVSLEESTDGEVALSTGSVAVRHVSLSEHVEVHRLWLEKAGKSAIESFPQFQQERAHRLSRIDFLERALQQLKELDPAHPWWNAALARLDELQEAMIEWDPTASAQPAWRSHVTGESETRRRLCNFVDLDGHTRCFDQHARFTPGPGRLHFRVDGSTIRLIVAHIGRKLE